MDGRAAAVTVEQVTRALELVGFLAVSGAADSAVHIGRENAAHAEALGEYALAVKLRHAVGQGLGHLRQWEPALAELTAAADEATRIGDPALQAVVWSTAAWTEARAGRPEDGLRRFAQAHAILLREPPRRETFVGAVNLGICALQLGLMDISEQWFDYGRDHLELEPDLVRRPGVWANRSVMEFEQGLAQEHTGHEAAARRWYERCEENGPRMEALVAECSSSPLAGMWLLNAAVNRGCCRAKLGDPEAALAHLDPVMDDADTQTTLLTRAAAHLGRAWAELALGRYSECRTDGEEAARLADAIGWVRWQADAHRALAGAAERSGDPAGRAAHEARSADLLSQLGWQTRLRRLGVSLGLAGSGSGSAPAGEVVHR